MHGSREELSAGALIHILIQPGRAKNTFKRLHCGVDHYLYPRVFDVNFTDLKHFISIALMVTRQEADTQIIAAGFK